MGLIGTDGNLVRIENITKREYFAAMAMQGLLALGPLQGRDHSVKGQIEHSVYLADALIAELSKSNENVSGAV